MIAAVVEYVKAHPYFFANLPLLALTAGLPRLFRHRDFARAAVFGGVACLPCSLLAATHFGAYWRPLLLGGLRFGIEDLAFAYSAGAAAWMAAAFCKRERCVVGDPSFRAAVRRMLPWGLALAADVALWLVGVDRMTATLISSAALLAFLLARRISLWSLALVGVAAFTPFYIVVVKAQFALWPNYASYWTAGGWGKLVLGIPRGELAWAAMFGALWPVVVASALNIRFARADTQHSGNTL